jgi:hypothetical protein
MSGSQSSGDGGHPQSILPALRHRRERRDKQQHGKDGIDGQLGFVQIVDKVDADLFFDHLREWYQPDAPLSTHGESSDKNINPAAFASEARMSA